MALNTYTERTPRVLYGGPRRRRTATTRFERNEHPTLGGHGSHMPLDTEIHWNWRNPLNIIPATILAVMLIAIVGVALGL